MKRKREILETLDSMAGRSRPTVNIGWLIKLHVIGGKLHCGLHAFNNIINNNIKKEEKRLKNEKKKKEKDVIKKSDVRIMGWRHLNFQKVKKKEIGCFKKSKRGIEYVPGNWALIMATKRRPMNSIINNDLISE